MDLLPPQPDPNTIQPYQDNVDFPAPLPTQPGVVPVFTDLPYYAMPDIQTANMSTGQIGSMNITPTGMSAGGGSAGAGSGGGVSMSGNGGQEQYTVYDANGNVTAILGQLISKTSVNQYGLWTNVGFFTGTVTANAGNMAGFVIASTTISKNNLTLDSGGKITLGTGNNVIIFDSLDATYRMVVGNATYASAPFTVSKAGVMTLGVTSGTYIKLDGPNAKMESSDYVAGVSGWHIGSDVVESQNLKARGLLQGVTFQYNVVSAVGGQLMVSNADSLATAMTAADNSTLTIQGNTTFAVNDILLIQSTTVSGVQTEWMRVTNVASAPTYVVTRDLANAYSANANPAWAKGVSVVAQGSSDGSSAYSGGWLRLIGQGPDSPYYSVFARTGVAYNAYKEIARFGDLNGIGPFVTETYGIFMGDYASGSYFTYDTISAKMVLNGYVQSSKGAFGGDGSDGALAGSSGTITIDCANAATIVKNYTSIAITGTCKVLLINPHPNGTTALFKSQGAVTMTSSDAAMIDASGMGAAGGAQVTGTGASRFAGNNGNPGLTNIGVFSGGGGATVAGGGGSFIQGVLGAQAFGINAAQQIALVKYQSAVVGGGGGSGGFFGSNGNTKHSGAGGRGGGAVIIECGGAFNFTTGAVSVAGLTGQNGTASGFISGGGGGGGGGSFTVLYNTLTANTGTVTYTGGPGGSIAAGTDTSQGGGGASVMNGSAPTTTTGGVGQDGYSLIAQNTVYA